MSKYVYILFLNIYSLQVLSKDSRFPDKIVDALHDESEVFVLETGLKLKLVRAREMSYPRYYLFCNRFQKAKADMAEDDKSRNGSKCEGKNAHISKEVADNLAGNR